MRTRHARLTLGTVVSPLEAGVALEGETPTDVVSLTRFKLKQNRPQRTDGCPWPGITRMAPCPEV